MRWPKYQSFSFSIIPSKEHPGLISFRMDWLDLRALQGTLKSLLQHHSYSYLCIELKVRIKAISIKLVAISTKLVDMIEFQLSYFKS